MKRISIFGVLFACLAGIAGAQPENPWRGNRLIFTDPANSKGDYGVGVRRINDELYFWSTDLGTTTSLSDLASTSIALSALTANSATWSSHSNASTSSLSSTWSSHSNASTTSLAADTASVAALSVLTTDTLGALVVDGTATDTMTVGDVCYLDDAGVWEFATTGTGKTRLVGVVQTTGTIALSGVVDGVKVFEATEAGYPLYLSQYEGWLSNTAESTSARIVGYAMEDAASSACMILLSPLYEPGAGGSYTINHSDLNLDDGTNPHGTTKSDVGLGNVENTKLSTWAGSTAIQTVGTITAGTWQGGTLMAGFIDADIARDAEVTAAVAAHTAVVAAHHTRYTSSEAVAAMGALGDTNPLNHEKYSNDDITSWSLALADSSVSVGYLVALSSGEYSLADEDSASSAAVAVINRDGDTTRTIYGGVCSVVSSTSTISQGASVWLDTSGAVDNAPTSGAAIVQRVGYTVGDVAAGPPYAVPIIFAPERERRWFPY